MQNRYFNKIPSFFFLIVYCALFYLFGLHFVANAKEKCFIKKQSDILVGAWTPSKPYIYQDQRLGKKLIGIDEELLNLFADKTGIIFEQEQTSFADAMADLDDGSKDFLMGVSFSEERAQRFYFSKAYRFEKNSIFSLRQSTRSISFNNINEFLMQLRLNNYKFGVVKGYQYISDEINEFINNEQNDDIIIQYRNDYVAFNDLVSNKIDYLISDNLLAFEIIAAEGWFDIIAETNLKSIVPVHIAFSYKTTNLDTLNNINRAIAESLNSKDYRSIITKYTQPILAFEVISSELLVIFIAISSIAFLLSGVLISAMEKFSIFGTIIITSLPIISINGTVNWIVNKSTYFIFSNPLYSYVAILILVICIIIGKIILEKILNVADDALMKKTLTFIDVCDALGEAIIPCVALFLTIVSKHHPLLFWSSIFAMVPTSFGLILRNFLTTRYKGDFLYDSRRYLIILFVTVSCALILKNSSHITKEQIEYNIIGSVVLCILLRLSFITRKIVNK
jgi:polar amino acid transport system substrate-binding protein